jgi:ABC-type uncharacterized transport system permease subunit
MEARVQSQFSPCGIFGEQSGTETCSSLSTWVSACQYHAICAAHCSLSGTIQPVSIMPSVLPTAVSLAPFRLSVPCHLCCPLQSLWHHLRCQYHSICAAHCSLSGTIQPVSIMPSVLPAAVCQAPILYNLNFWQWH